MGELYEQTSKKTANNSKDVKLFPDRDDDYTLSFLESRWLEMDGARDDSKWELRMEQEDSEIVWNEDGTANVNLPIERSQARLKEADEVAQKPIIRFVPTEPDDIYKLDVTEEVFDFSWNEANTDENLARLRQCKRIFGTAVWKEYVKTERSTQWQLSKRDKDGKITGEHKRVERSWLQGKLIDIRNFWIDPVHNQDDAVDCFEAEVDISKDQLESLKDDPNYKNIEEALKSQQLDSEIRNRVFFTSEEEAEGISIKNPKYTFWHYYNKDKGVYIVSVNLKTIIRESVNPCPTGGLPYIILVDEPKYMSLYGRGMHEQLEGAKYELNVVANQIIDLVRESSTNTLLLGNETSIDDNQIINGVGRILTLDGDSYQWSTPPQSDKGLFNVRNLLQQDATMITGIDAYSVQGDMARTLGQEEIREVNRLKSLATSIDEYNFFLVRMARLRLAYIQFYISKTTGRKIIGNKKYRSIPLRGKKLKQLKRVGANGELEEKGYKIEEKEGFTDFLEIKPDMIMSNIDVTVETPLTSSALKQLKKQRHQEIFNSVIQLLQVRPELAQELDKFTRASLEELIELAGSNPDKYFDPATDEGEKEEVRSKVLGDLPLPFKSVEQPERSNLDEFAAISGAMNQGENQQPTR